MIVGLGIDVVDVTRFARALDRTPRLAHRLFTEDERAVQAPHRLAARFAAKEAVAKALGAPAGLRWHDAEVRHDETGAPRLCCTGTVATAAERRGGRRWHLSLSHDGATAVAVVLLED